MRHTVTMGGGSRGIRRAGPARDLEARRLLRRVRHPPQRGLHHRRQPPTAHTHRPLAALGSPARHAPASHRHAVRQGFPGPRSRSPKRGQGGERAPLSRRRRSPPHAASLGISDLESEGGHARRSSAPGSGVPPDGGAAGAAIVALAPTRPLTAQRVVRKRQREPVPRGLTSSSARPRFGIVWPIGSLRRRCYRRSRPVHPYSEERRYEYGDAI